MHYSEGAFGTVGCPSVRQGVGNHSRILAAHELFCVSLSVTNMSRRISSVKQMSYLVSDLSRLVNGRHHRWLTIWFGSSAGVALSYRLDRMLYLAIGRSYVLLRPLFYPLFLFFRILSSKHEISYHADIGKGLCILHPSLGVVVSAKAVCGSNLTLTGGNCIGGRKPMVAGGVRLGANVFLGVNAVILGPCVLGDDVHVGAGAVVVSDLPVGASAVGIPAKARN